MEFLTLLVTGEKEWNKKHPDIKILEEIRDKDKSKNITLYANINFDFTLTPELELLKKIIQTK